MKYGKKFYLKVAALFILSYLLMWLDLDGITNLRDFMTGVIFAATLIIVLYLVYSCIRTIYEGHANQDKPGHDKK